MLERIVAAARRLFAEHGFHQTAMADLAREANVSVGAIYRSFDGKADIIHAIVVADTDQMAHDLETLTARARAGTETVFSVIERIILQRVMQKDEALTHEILAEGHRNPEVANTIANFSARYERSFRELACIANPALSGERLEGAVELLLACVFGIGHRSLTHPSLGKEATARVATELIMAAIQGDGER